LIESTSEVAEFKCDFNLLFVKWGLGLSQSIFSKC